MIATALVVAAGTVTGIGAADDDAAPASPPLRSAAHTAPDVLDRLLRERFADGELTLSDGTTVPVTVGAAPGYLPDDACFECHQRLSRGYRSVGMSRSMYPIDTENLIEDFENAHFHHAPSRRHYEMTVRDGGVYQKRYQVDENGERYNEIERRVAYVVGSGANVRTYLYRTPGGELFELPLMWYTRTASWGMGPGFDVPGHSDFSRVITRECLFCHNAYPEVPVGSDEMNRPHWFPEELPHGIGCQRCHGPGAEHVRLADDLDAAIEDVRAAIVNPVDLEPARREDVCMQCHLQPRSGSMSFARVLGRTDYSHRAGEPLHDYLLHIEHDGPEPAPHAERFQINHHPYRLFQSACWTESEGQLGCLTCHDPHFKVRPDERAAHYRTACLTCHEIDRCDVAAMGVAADGPESVDCVACHMPRRRTQDVIQVTVTDHRIVRRPAPESERLAPLEEIAPLTGGVRVHYRPELAPTGDTAALYPILSGANDDRPEDIEALRLLMVETPRVEPMVVLAGKLLAAQRYDETAQACRWLLEQDADMEVAHGMLGEALLGLGRAAEAIVPLERAVAINPGSPVSQYALGKAYAATGRTDDAITRLAEATRLRPLYADAHFYLASLHLSTNAVREAADGFARSLAADPARADAALYRGVALMQLGDAAGAGTSWRRGLVMNPADTRLLEAVAMGRLLANEPDAALAAARRAAAAGADPTNCALIEAFCHVAKRDGASATSAYRRALATQAQPSSNPIFRSLLAQRAAALFQRSR